MSDPRLFAAMLEPNADPKNRTLGARGATLLPVAGPPPSGVPNLNFGFGDTAK
ncbi:MAG: hypothetical protein ACLQVL_07275 [Terriglobia bacterium]